MDNLNNLHISVRERIFTLLKSKSIQQKDFAKTIEVSISTVTDWKKGKSTSFMKKLTPIAKALSTSETWLLTGDGEEKKPTPDEGGGLSEEQLEVIRRYDAASPELRAAALAVLRSGEEPGKGQASVSTDK